jgi:NADH:ubiquinone oxidoreductase subunit F (NADH-binding)
MKTTLRDLIYNYAGGPLDGRKIKAVIPGGSSVPILLDDQLDIPASFDDVAKAGSMLGSAGIIVMDDTTCMVWAARNLLYFYKHESCGKCTPCREGGDWLYKILTRIENGEGEMRDIDLLVSIGNNIVGKTLCAFGDAAATPVPCQSPISTGPALLAKPRTSLRCSPPNRPSHNSRTGTTARRSRARIWQVLEKAKDETKSGSRLDLQR